MDKRAHRLALKDPNGGESKLNSDENHSPFAQPSPPPKKKLSNSPRRNHNPAKAALNYPLSSSSLSTSCSPLDHHHHQRDLAQIPIPIPSVNGIQAVLQPVNNHKRRSRIPPHWFSPQTQTQTQTQQQQQQHQQHQQQQQQQQHHQQQHQQQQQHHQQNKNTPHPSSCSHPYRHVNLLPPAVDPADQAEVDGHPTPSRAFNLTPTIYSASFPHPRSIASASRRAPASSASSASSHSYHHSIDHTDSEFESLHDDETEEVLSASSHSASVSAPGSAPGSAPAPASASSSASAPASASASALDSTLAPSTPHFRPPSPRLGSERSLPLPATPSTHSGSAELPFARPSPNLHIRRPSHAPSLPRSRTPSLVIRPRLSSSVLGSASSRSSISLHVHTTDLARPAPGPGAPVKTASMRSLGWGRAPAAPPRLLSLETSKRPDATDALIADYILPAHRLHSLPAPKSPAISSGLSVEPDAPQPAKARRLKDRLTLASTAPLRIIKKQSGHGIPSGGAGRRIVSGLRSVLPTDERRRAAMKRQISYPLFSRASDDGGMESEEDEGVEAATRALEGRRDAVAGRWLMDEAEAAARRTRTTLPWSTMASSPVRGSEEEEEHEDEATGVWKQRLRRQVSVTRFLRQRHRPTSILGDKEVTEDKGSQKQVRKKTSGKLGPLLRKASAVSLRPHVHAEGRPVAGEGDVIAEEEEEEVVTDANGQTRIRTVENRARWGRSASLQSIMAAVVGPGGTPRSGPGPTSSQLIREKRRVFEEAQKRALAMSPTSPGGSVCRNVGQRKATPLEIKLKDGTQSVRALVDKFETRKTQESLGRKSEGGGGSSVGGGSREGGRRGVIRGSLMSLWSGGSRSVEGSVKNSYRSSIRKAGDLEMKEATVEEEEQDRDQGWKTSWVDEDNQRKRLSGVQIKREDDKDHRRSGLEGNGGGDGFSINSWRSSLSSSGRLSPDQRKSSRLGSESQTRFSFGSETCPEDSVPRHLRASCSGGLDLISETVSQNGGGEQTNSSVPSLLQRPPTTMVESQSMWMTDGSERMILVGGGRMQLAKKRIPFPSFEDDEEYSQKIVPVEPGTQKRISRPPVDHGAIKQDTLTEQRATNRFSSFLKTRKFDDDQDGGQLIGVGGVGLEFEDDEVQEGMMGAEDVGIQESPTTGRGRRSGQRSMLWESPGARRWQGSGRASPPAHHVDPASPPGSRGTVDSDEARQMCLSVGRCSGLGSKMFSSIRIVQSLDTGPGRRSASTILQAGPMFDISPSPSCPGSAIRCRTQTEGSMSPVDLVRPRLSSGSPIVRKKEGGDGLEVNANDEWTVGEARERCCSSSSNSSESSSDFRILKSPRNQSQTGLTEMREVIINEEEKNLSIRGHSDFMDGSNLINELMNNNKKKKNKSGLLVDEVDDDEEESLEDYEELKRLFKVEEVWRKFCGEVVDELKRSQEKWPDNERSLKVLEEFVRPSTKAAIEKFLKNSQLLYRSSTTTRTKSEMKSISDQLMGGRMKMGDERKWSEDFYRLTPPSKHPFEESIPSTPCGIGEGFNGFLTPTRNCKVESVVVTLPVPSAFVSPERFSGRLIKTAVGKSGGRGSRPATVASRLGGGIGGALGRARLTSVQSNWSMSSNGKVVLGERSVNVSPAGVGSGKSGAVTVESGGRSTKKAWKKSVLSENGKESMGESYGKMDRFESVGFKADDHHGRMVEELNDGEVGSSEEVGILVGAGEGKYGFVEGFRKVESVRMKQEKESQRKVGNQVCFKKFGSDEEDEWIGNSHGSKSFNQDGDNGHGGLRVKADNNNNNGEEKEEGYRKVRKSSSCAGGFINSTKMKSIKTTMMTTTTTTTMMVMNNNNHSGKKHKIKNVKKGVFKNHHHHHHNNGCIGVGNSGGGNGEGSSSSSNGNGNSGGGSGLLSMINHRI